jgi:hypothetical protein
MPDYKSVVLRYPPEKFKKLQEIKGERTWEEAVFEEMMRGKT